MTMMKKLMGLASVAIACQALPAHATLVSYNGFANTAGLSMAGSARATTTLDGTVMRLTSATANLGGAAYSTTPITLGSNAIFSTNFNFRFTSPGGIAPADGIAFILSNSASGLGGTGFDLGLPGATLAKSVAIEFDTFNNGTIDSNSSNQVGIDVNGSNNSVYANSVYGIANCGASTYKTAGCMADGDLWNVNISYDGSKLTTTLSDPAKAASYIAINSYAIDIGSILGTTQAYVGFTASTGSGYENQDIVNWQFANTTQLAGKSGTVAEPSSLALLGLGAVGLGFASRRNARARARLRAGNRG
jgi:hypothetical protein